MGTSHGAATTCGTPGYQASREVGIDEGLHAVGDALVVESPDHPSLGEQIAGEALEGKEGILGRRRERSAQLLGSKSYVRAVQSEVVRSGRQGSEICCFLIAEDGALSLETFEMFNGFSTQPFSFELLHGLTLGNEFWN